MPSYLSLAEITQDESIIKTSALIGSQWIDGKQKFAVMNPATGKEIALITDVGRDEILRQSNMRNTPSPHLVGVQSTSEPPY